MQAVIFAAGRGTRMGRLTESVPKPMLTVAGAPILEHKIKSLPTGIDEVILIVGYYGSVIHDYFGGQFDGRRILYCEQENTVGGTADALWQAKDILKGTFLAINGDDLYATKDLQACLDTSGWGVLVLEQDGVWSGGKVVTDAGHRIRDIQEGTHEGHGFVNAGVYVLDERIFSYAPAPKAPGSSELGLPQTMLQAADDIDITMIVGSQWIQITSPDDLRKAEAALAA